MSKWGKRDVGVQPDGKARQSQVVTSYGPGAMIDLVDHAVLIGGLDHWRYDKDRGVPVLGEPRLRDAVAERMRQLGRDLAVDDAFREPPPGDDKAPSRATGIAALEFPQWFVCQNPTCRALMRSSQLERKAGRCVHACTRTKVTECVPVRFVTACVRGHLDEFPWVWFAHKASVKCAAPSLRLHEGATGDFSEVSVACACGASAALSQAMVPDANPLCSGARPWLGDREDLCVGVAVGQSPVAVQLECGAAVARDQHGEVQHAARLAVEAGPVPDVVPAIGVQKLDERLVEVVDRGHGLVDVGGAEHFLAVLQAGVEPVLVRTLVHSLLLLQSRSS